MIVPRSRPSLKGSEHAEVVSRAALLASLSLSPRGWQRRLGLVIGCTSATTLALRPSIRSTSYSCNSPARRTTRFARRSNGFIRPGQASWSRSSEACNSRKCAYSD